MIQKSIFTSKPVQKKYFNCYFTYTCNCVLNGHSNSYKKDISPEK